MFEKVVHQWFRVPYILHIRVFRKVKQAKVTVLFIHGIGNNGSAWDEVIAKLPEDVQVVSLDLLGFGESPKPPWALYDAKLQATSVLATYFRLRISTKLIIVGHSLGSLVAIEIAKRYPLLVKHLILCAPPFYRPDDGAPLPKHPDAVLRRLYMQAEKYPGQFALIAAFATKYQLVNKSFSVTSENLHSFMGTLRGAILNQTSLDDAIKLRVPIDILRGSLDPLIVVKNIKTLINANANVTEKVILAGHEIRAGFVSPIVAAVKKAAAPPRKFDDRVKD